MAWYSKLFGGGKRDTALEGKIVEVDPGLLVNGRNSFGQSSTTWGQSNFTKLSREGYEFCASVYRCASLVAITASRIPIGIMREVTNGEDERILRHPLLELLKRPNPNHGYSSWIKQACLMVQIGGVDYIWLNRLTSGKIQEMWNIPANQILINRGMAYGQISSYQWNPPNYSGRVIAPTDMLRIQYDHPRDELAALGPTQVSSVAIDNINESESHQNSLLNNGARPGMVIKPTENSGFVFEKEQKDELLNDLNQRTGGKNVGNVYVFRHGDIDLQPFGWSPVDLDLMNGRRIHDVDIANAFGVAPELIGLQKTYENFQTAQQALYRDTVIPLVNMIIDEFTAFIPGMIESGLYFKVLEDDIEVLQEDKTNRVTRVNTLIDRGVISRNEARTELGMGAVDDDPAMDARTVAGIVSPLEDILLGMTGNDLGAGPDARARAQAGAGDNE